jgi:NAD-dependent SIR2 family protein deacetylase
VKGRIGFVNEQYELAARELRSAEALLISAGAGMGVDSGLPDFRGNEGFWNAYPPMAKLGITFSEMANPGWFERDPGLAWGFYGHRLNLYRRTKPHRGFQLLLQLTSRMPGGYFVFTSNVDGQFQAAGFDQNRIEECHGSIHHLQCTVPCGPYIWEAGEITVEVDLKTFRAREPWPECERCGRLSRPNILMFGDWHWLESRSEEQSARLRAWLERVERESWKLAIIECGAGKAVPTVRMKSEQLARRHSAAFIRINPRDFDVPRSGDVGLAVGSEEGLRGLCERL